MPEMKVLDLFCGAAGGWSLGLHRAGFETVAACEIDPWRRGAFAKNNPGVLLYGDIRDLSADGLRNDLGFLPGIICGSPPCQDASLANTKGKGVDGEHTGLFFEAVRLVREVRPRWALFENVPGLRTRGYDRVHDGLEEAGYTVWPLVVGAAHAGAPHLRKRVWIIAHATQEQVGRAGLARPQVERNYDAFAGRCAFLEAWPDWNEGPPDVSMLDDGIPKKLARQAIDAFGDAVVPQLTEAIGRVVRQMDGMG